LLKSLVLQHSYCVQESGLMGFLSNQKAKVE